jgi:hypothetical protein
MFYSQKIRLIAEIAVMPGRPGKCFLILEKHIDLQKALSAIYCFAGLTKDYLSSVKVDYIICP